MVCKNMFFDSQFTNSRAEWQGGGDGMLKAEDYHPCSFQPHKNINYSNNKQKLKMTPCCANRKIFPLKSVMTFSSALINPTEPIPTWPVSFCCAQKNHYGI